MPDPDSSASGETPDLDPQALHRAEQGLAAFRTFGAGLARMYDAMLEEGMPEEAAVRAVCAYSEGLARSVFSGPSSTGEEEEA